MNNYCRNCGKKLESNVETCTKCNAEVFEKRINVEQKKEELKEYKKRENKYVIIIITLFSLSYLLPYLIFSESYNFITYISSLLSLASIITLIYARITMNESKKIKVMFSAFMSLVILYLLFNLLVFITCSSILNGGCY